jgi:hypothetical protein
MTITAFPNKSKRPKRAEESIIGRDGYIMAKALAYAITTIERLPDQWQEWSDCEDMKLIFDPYFGGARFVFDDAKLHLDGANGRPHDTA